VEIVSVELVFVDSVNVFILSTISEEELVEFLQISRQFISRISYLGKLLQLNNTK